MELSELNDLEVKATEIVSTLDNLEQEIAKYKDKTMKTGEVLNKIGQLTDAVKAAADKLSAAADTVSSASLKEQLEHFDGLLERSNALFQKSHSMFEDERTSNKQLESTIIREGQKGEECLSKLAEIHSTTVETTSDISDRISRLEEMVASIQASLATIESSNESCLQQIEAKLDSTTKQNDEVFSKLELFEKLIGRIDRNTQKGFGKEKGTI